MGPPQKEPLRVLTSEEPVCLERIARAGSERVDRARRARALLAVAAGRSFAQAAVQAGVRRPSRVAHLVERFHQRGLAALTSAAGRGRKPTYDGTARVQIVATAQQPPARRPDGTATWSLLTLERARRQQGALPRLGATTIRRVLEDAGSAYQRTRTWCPSGTAPRQRTSGVVRVTDPQTEQKRGRSSTRTAGRRRRG
jgi:Homeodomain-like domain